MNPRERVLAMIVVGVVLVAGGGFMFNAMFLEPLAEREASIRSLREDGETKEKQRKQILAEKPKLERARQLSLPPDNVPADKKNADDKKNGVQVNMARREYEKYLTQLLLTSGFTPGSFLVKPMPLENRSGTARGAAAKKQPFTRLTFTVQGPARLETVVRMMKTFYDTGLMHQIKNFSLQLPSLPGPDERPGDLEMNMTVEALVVDGAVPRPALLPNIDPRLLALDVVAGLRKGPLGLGLLTWAASPAGPRGPGVLAVPPRQYALIGTKNIFTGPPPTTPPPQEIDLTRFVDLTDITDNEKYYQAWLYDKSTGHPQRLRNTPGFNQFRVKDNNNKTLVVGVVVHMDLRDVIFRVDGNGSLDDGDFAAEESVASGADAKYYRLHIGQSIQEALRTPLSPEEVATILKKEPPPEVNVEEEDP